MEREPVATFKVHEHLRSKLCDLYESDAIFDKFQCCLSRDGSRLATGSYGNQFRTFDSHSGGTDTLEVTKNPQRLRRLRQQGMAAEGGADGKKAAAAAAAAAAGRGRGCRTGVGRLPDQDAAHGVAPAGGRPRVRGVELAVHLQRVKEGRKEGRGG